ncbi:PREDICTED: uncharacterized protein LOC104824514 [Tarenaya hassleriana]|uniref:uncharacterized protein LOC104824514 n=1 Tax=Tarenaya hassleriana TaxID=28532 RepID=UPI00053C1C1F|nr:PREDICTED: uncharacterized protein LOC104824514 [Tarenaya hassleriana]
MVGFICFQPRLSILFLSLFFQKKRKRELAWSDGEASTASGTTEKSGDSNFQKEGRKLKLHDPCSPQTGDVSNASNHKGMVVEDVPDKTVQDNSSSRQKFLELLSGENEGIKRPVIPVAPGFQAKIPDWIGSTKKGKFYGSPADSKTLRLLGIDVWPTYSLRKKTVKREVGKGRPNSCSCTSPGSTICITKHTREARELLRADLGSVFYTWKFDKMGEAISKSWTAREEHKFEHLVERNPLPGSKGFWGIVSKAFPTKTMTITTMISPLGERPLGFWRFLDITGNSDSFYCKSNFVRLFLHRFI